MEEPIIDETPEIGTLVAEVSSILQVDDVPVNIPESVESAMDEPTVVMPEEHIPDPVSQEPDAPEAVSEQIPQESNAQ